MNAVIYQLVCTRFFRPFVVKYIKKLQEKRFHFTKNFAYILPQNGLKVSNSKGFLLISRHYLDFCVIENKNHAIRIWHVKWSNPFLIEGLGELKWTCSLCSKKYLSSENIHENCFQKRIYPLY